MTFLEKRRARIARGWDLTDEVVVIGAGDLQPIPGNDQFQPFRVHAEHRYLADSDLPGHVLLYDPRDGWTHFAPRLTQDELVWVGGEQAAGVPLAELPDRVAGRTVAALGCVPADVPFDEELSARLRKVVTEARRRKDAEEMRRLRRAADVTAAGHRVARAAIRPGRSERQVQWDLERAFLEEGGERASFESIVATGSNAAVLHFAPTDRVLAAGEMVLVDAGAEVEGYAGDVTRTWPVDDDFSPRQRALYDIVLEAQKDAIAKCVPGKEFRELHVETAVAMTRGLVDFGLMRGDPESLVERGAHGLFFPHGLGHMLGLCVHDVGGRLKGRAPEERLGYRFLRTDLPLAEGYVVTIEPGLYFIPALLDDPELRETFADVVHWEKADAMKDFGGIRIEDDVHVTNEGPEVLTAAIPK